MQGKLPQHVAIIMDGNGRWAKQRNLSRTAGHRAGLSAVRKVVEGCLQQGVNTLTLFAFGRENWRRPADEVAALMSLFLRALQREVKKLHNNNVRLRILGDRQGLSQKIQQSIDKAEQLTQNNTALCLNIATNYSGCWDIVQATQAIAEKVSQGELSPESINETLFSQHLVTQGTPDPDLFIRTSGEKRISNFLLWQLAYTEFYFTDIHWPDFDQQALDSALIDFAGRARRFGYTDEQLEKTTHA